VYEDEAPVEARSLDSDFEEEGVEEDDDELIQQEERDWSSDYSDERKYRRRRPIGRPGFPATVPVKRPWIMGAGGWLNMSKEDRDKYFQERVKNFMERVKMSAEERQKLYEERKDWISKIGKYRPSWARRWGRLPAGGKAKPAPKPVEPKDVPILAI